jgi:hypothetical protein
MNLVMKVAFREGQVRKVLLSNLPTKSFNTASSLTNSVPLYETDRVA